MPKKSKTVRVDPPKRKPDSTAKLMDCRDNFYDKKGKPFVVRCPSCMLENWAMAVASGQCAWCGWKAAKRKKSNA